MRMRRPGACSECGLCATVCPVVAAGRKNIVSFLSGGVAPEACDVWLCTSCWRCQDVCPEGVDIHALMMEQRRGEPAPEGYRQAFDNVLSCGYALDLGPEINESRARWGLEPFELASPERIAALLGRDKDS